MIHTIVEGLSGIEEDNAGNANLYQVAYCNAEICGDSSLRSNVPHNKWGTTRTNRDTNQA